MAAKAKASGAKARKPATKAAQGGPRANWKGHLRLSLVSCAVGLYPAVSQSGRLKCHTVNIRTGNRIKEDVLDSVTLEQVPREDRVKGCEVAKNDLVAVTDEELAEIQLESTHTINLETFVGRDEVDERYFEKPYYLAPEDDVSEEAFAVIRDALADRGMAGLGRVVMYRRERMILLEPFGKGILATLLRFEDEMRAPDAVFEGIGDFEAPEDMREMAALLIDRNKGSFDPSKFTDRYEEALTALVKSKAQGKRLKEPKSKPASTTKPSSLLEILRRSLDSDKKPEPAPQPRRQAAAGRPGPAHPAPRRKAPGGARRRA